MQKEPEKIHKAKERINKTIKEYSNQGIHRTGTEVDNESAQWFVNKIKNLGLKPELEGFQLNRIEVDEA